MLLGGAGCVCLLLLLCVAGLSTFGAGILASLAGGGTPIAFLTMAPETPSPFAIATRATDGPPPILVPTARFTPAIVLPTIRLTPLVVLPTVRLTPPIVLPTIRLTPSAAPTSRVTLSANAGVLTAVKFAPGILASDDSAVDPLASFPAGTPLMYAAFAYAEMRDGMPYRSEWLKNGVLQIELKTNGTWHDGIAGNWWATLSNSKGIPAGAWQYNFYVNERLATTGKVTVEAAVAGQPTFTAIIFAGDKDANDQPIDPALVTSPHLDAGISKLWAFFDGVSVPGGTQFSSQWFHNGKNLTDKKTYTWNLQPNENNYLSIFNTDGSDLEPGTYELKLWIGTRLVKVAAVILAAP